MKIIVSGLCGYMGQEISKLAKINYRNVQLVGGVDILYESEKNFPCCKDFKSVSFNADCIIDFSHHTLIDDLLDYALENNLKLVIATTGHSESERQKIIQASKRIPIFYSANTSIAISVLIESAKKIASLMPNSQIEIIEKHHSRKLDAPSGTALMIKDALLSVNPNYKAVYGRYGRQKRQDGEIGIHSLRLGNTVGEHEILISTENQEISLKHTALSRGLFAEGAIESALFLQDKTHGLFSVKDLL